MAIIILTVARTPLLEGMGTLLRIDNAQKGAEAIVVLSGDPFNRVPKAAWLYKNGYAKKVIIIDKESSKRTGQLEKMGYKLPDSSLLSIQILQEEGVNKADIIHIEGTQAASTIDEARIVKIFSEERGYKRFILVTTAFHTGRALWIFHKIFKNSDVKIEMAAADHAEFNESNWWKVEEGFLAYFNEYLKWMYYLAHY